MGTSADQLSTEQIISAIARLSLPELEQVFDHVLVLQARRKATALSAAESALLARVNQGLPVALRDRSFLVRMATCHTLTRPHPRYAALEVVCAARNILVNALSGPSRGPYAVAHPRSQCVCHQCLDCRHHLAVCCR
jgi:hypothetical protein